MIANYLSAMWAAIAPALGNHLWQSTLCVVIAGLLTLILRKNHARARYGLWLAASAKFLVPFSLLVVLGNHLARPGAELRSAPAGGLYFAMEELSRPFTQPTMPAISPATPSTASPSAMHLLPALLAAVWLCGLVVVLFAWYVRWRRVSAALREAMPLREGREVEALRRLERLAGIGKPMELWLSTASLEPGIFGIVRPLLVWPKGISEHLEDGHLEAILAHEVWHVRRRDNLAAALHMVVEAIFWFHPLVWWLGARLVEERERACDEEVLRLGSEPQVYAESILKACEFCVESPLACVSGVTGADLKERMVRIMAQRSAAKLSFTRKVLLAAVGIAAVAGPVVFGLLHAPLLRAQSTQATSAPLPSFEVASIRPNPGPWHVLLGYSSSGPRLTLEGYTVSDIIGEAYDLKNYQVTLAELHARPIVNGTYYNIVAKAEGDGTPTRGEFRQMLQNAVERTIQSQFPSRDEGDAGLCAGRRQEWTEIQGKRPRSGFDFQSRRKRAQSEYDAGKGHHGIPC